MELIKRSKYPLFTKELMTKVPVFTKDFQLLQFDDLGHQN